MARCHPVVRWQAEVPCFWPFGFNRSKNVGVHPRRRGRTRPLQAALRIARRAPRGVSRSRVSNSLALSHQEPFPPSHEARRRRLSPDPSSFYCSKDACLLLSVFHGSLVHARVRVYARSGFPRRVRWFNRTRTYAWCITQACCCAQTHAPRSRELQHRPCVRQSGRRPRARRH